MQAGCRGGVFLTPTLGVGSFCLTSLPPGEGLELESRVGAGLVEGMEVSTSSLQEMLVLGSEEGQGLTFMVQPCILAVFILKIRYVPMTLLYVFCVSDSHISYFLKPILFIVLATWRSLSP